MIDAIEGEGTIKDFLKTVTIKDVIYWAAEAWDEVTPETIKKSWKKIGLIENENDDEDSDDDMPLINLISKLPGCESTDENDMSEWMSKDEQFEVTDGTIINMVSDTTAEESEEEVAQESEPAMSHSDGYAALVSALRYVEQQPNATAADTLLLRRWRDIAARNRCSATKQKTLDSFFKRN